MPQPSEIIASVDTDEGKLELIRQASGHWIIAIDHRPLMSSFLHRSEVALADLACAPLKEKTAPRVLVAGLGMGYTLRAALDNLPPDAEVITAELNPIVAGWCRGPIAELSENALDDPRVKLEISMSASLSRAPPRPERTASSTPAAIIPGRRPWHQQRLRRGLRHRAQLKCPARVRRLRQLRRPKCPRQPRRPRPSASAPNRALLRIRTPGHLLLCDHRQPPGARHPSHRPRHEAHRPLWRPLG